MIDMILATYIDGDQQTLYGHLLERHSVSASVRIKKEHIPQWDHLGLDEEEDPEHPENLFAYPTRRDKPVPVTFSTDDLSDIVSDMASEDFVAAYYYDLEAMLEDPCGMGVVYLMKNQT